MIMFVCVITGPLPGHLCPSIRKKAANKKNESKKEQKVEVRPP
jgi:hypothetical protein